VFGALCLETEFLEEKIVFFFNDCFPVLEKNERDCCFHQNGVTAHNAKTTITTTTTTAFLHYFFCDGVVGRRLCLTQFPETKPDDFFL
jgi:hypothetical protein